MPRKAVTPRKAVELDRSRTPLLIAVMLFIGIGATAGAIAWGRSDAGQINVAATINTAGQTSGDGSPQQAATAEHSALPNGGLVPSSGADVAPVPEPAPTDATTTATTTGEVLGEAGTETSEEEAVPTEEGADTETTEVAQ